MQVGYAVTYNKSQGKTLRRAVVDVRVGTFAHGQLYVALSRVRTRHDLMILADPEQVLTHPDLGGEYVSVTNVVERRMLEDSMSDEDRLRFRQRYPFPGTAVAHAGPVPYALPNEVAAAQQGAARAT